MYLNCKQTIALINIVYVIIYTCVTIYTWKCNLYFFYVKLIFSSFKIDLDI